MMKTVKGAKARLPLNLITNFVSLSLTTLIGLWITPFLIKQLGVAVYGIVPLLLSLLHYFNIFSGAMTTAIARFLTLSIQKKDYQSANEYYCGALCGVGLVGGGLLVVTASLLPWLQHLITIPQGFELQTKVLLLLVVLSTVLQLLSTVFNVGFFANHRFDLQNSIKIVANVSKALCIAFGLAYVSKTLYVVGGGYLLLSGITMTGGYLFRKKLVPELVFQRNAFSFFAFRQMTTMGGWTLLNNMGVLLYFNIDYIIINRVLGAEAGGLYAPIVQLNLLVTLIVTSLNEIFSPIIIQSIGENNNAAIQRRTYTAIRYFGLISLLPIVLICGFAKSVLGLWLGEDFAGLHTLVWLLMIPLILSNSAQPLFALLNGLNAVKYLGIATCVGGLLNLALSLILVQYTDLGLYAVAFATVLSLFIRNVIFVPFYSMKLINGKVSKIYGPRALLFLSGLLIIGGLTWIDSVLPPNNLPMLIFYWAVCGLIYALFLFVFVLNKNEKQYCLSFVLKRRGV